MLSKIQSLGCRGVSGYAVSVECHVSNGLPGFDIVGLPDAAGREILAGQDGCLRRGPVAVRSGSGRSDCGIYGTSEDGLPSFGRLSEGLRYPAAANRGKLIIFIAVSVSVGMYPTVRPFNGERL